MKKEKENTPTGEVPKIENIPTKPRGHHQALGDFDMGNQANTKALRKAGTIVSIQFVLEAAEGVISAKNITLLLTQLS